MHYLISDGNIDPALVWRRPLRAWEQNSVAVLKSIILQTHLREINDVVFWSHNNACFSIKDAYKLLIRTHISEEDWDLIWKNKVPGRIKILLWKVAKNILPTKALIFSRTRKGDGRCMTCNSSDEDISHIFWKCSEVQDIWNVFFKWWDILVSDPIRKDCEFNDWKILKMVRGSQCPKIWKMSIAAILWSIWLGHNSVVFENKKMTNLVILHLVKLRTRSWAFNANLISLVNENLWSCDPRAAINHHVWSSWQLFLEENLHKYSFIALVDGAWNGILEG